MPPAGFKPDGPALYMQGPTFFSPLRGQRGIGGAVRTQAQMFIAPPPAILAAQFKQLARNVRSLRVPLEWSVQQVMMPSFAVNFLRQGRPIKWDELKPTTREDRRRRGYNPSKPILRRTGKLKEKMTGDSMSNIRVLWTINGQLGTARMTKFHPDLRNPRTGVNYGAIHQWGAVGRSKMKVDPRKVHTTTLRAKSGEPMAARPYLLVQPQDEVEVQVVFELWLEERIAAGIGLRRVHV